MFVRRGVLQYAPIMVLKFQYKRISNIEQGMSNNEVLLSFDIRYSLFNIRYLVGQPPPVGMSSPPQINLLTVSSKSL